MRCSNNETSDNDVQGDRKDSVKYEYPMTVIQPNQPVAPYETATLRRLSLRHPPKQMQLQRLTLSLLVGTRTHN